MYAALGNECSVPDLLGTRILQNNLEFHLEENDEIFEGYGTLTSSYPYRQYKLLSGKTGRERDENSDP